jgi:hypothetical protein
MYPHVAMTPLLRLFVATALSLPVVTGCAVRCPETCIDESDAGTDAFAPDARTPDASRDADVTDVGTSDAGAADASYDAARDIDADTVDAATSDDAAASDDAGPACDPTRIRFLPAGVLMEGRLCDDVFACVPTRADADALEAAAPLFDCAIPTEGACAGVSCVMRPSLLDAAEVAQICAVTTLPALTDLICFVYL